MAAPQRPVPPSVHPAPPSKDGAHHAHVRLDSVRSAKHGGTAEKTVRSGQPAQWQSRRWSEGATREEARAVSARPKNERRQGGRQGSTAGGGAGEEDAARREGWERGPPGVRCAAPLVRRAAASGAHRVHIRPDVGAPTSTGGGPLTAPSPQATFEGGRWWHIEDDSRPPTRRRPPSGSPFCPF